MSRSSLRREARSARAAASSFEAERLLALRAALFSAPDVARDVLADFAAFTRFDRNGLDADIFFTSPGSPRWSSALEIFALEVTERNMRSLYESAKGWGWDSDAKRAELQSPENRYLVARARGVDANGADGGEFLGFVSFRFVSEAALDVLYVYELQLAAQAQRKGLGKFLMQLCELIARKQGMQATMLTVFKHNVDALHFYARLRYEVDESSPSMNDDADAAHEILCKIVNPSAAAAARVRALLVEQ